MTRRHLFKLVLGAPLAALGMVQPHCVTIKVVFKPSPTDFKAMLAEVKQDLVKAFEPAIAHIRSGAADDADYFKIYNVHNDKVRWYKDGKLVRVTEA